jgi:3-hydroxyisobutyrate dehydrogenase-like beta-hydroxyacid dehydrogenase
VVGFVGLGNMGEHMAARLLAAGQELAVYDTREEAVAAFAGKGARACASVGELADVADTVLVSLPTPHVVRDVASELVVGRAVRTYVDLSTTGSQVAQEVATVLGAAGIDVVDAPVSGGPAGAEAGSLTLMASGSPAAIECVRPLLETIGSKLFVVGDEPGQGQTAKVVNNLLSGAAIALTGEAVVLGIKAGLDPRTLLDVLAVSSGSNTAVTDKFPKQVLTRAFAHGFRAELMAKDVHLCLEEAERLGVPMAVGRAVDALWARAVAELEPGADCTDAVRLVEREAGVEVSQ